MSSASGLAAAQALFGAVQASVVEAKPNEDTEDDEPVKDALKTAKEVCHKALCHAPWCCALAFGTLTAQCVMLVAWLVWACFELTQTADAQGDAEGKDKDGVKAEDGGLGGMGGMDKGKDEAVAKVVEALSSVMPTGPGVPPPPSPPKEA